MRQLFRTFDQAAIYLLTAGTSTPYFLRYLAPHGWGWMIPLMWGLAFAGVWHILVVAASSALYAGIALYVI